jgi:hypothetical protein
MGLDNMLKGTGKNWHPYKNTLLMCALVIDGLTVKESDSYFLFENFTLISCKFFYKN